MYTQDTSKSFWVISTLVLVLALVGFLSFYFLTGRGVSSKDTTATSSPQKTAATTAAKKTATPATTSKLKTYKNTNPAFTLEYSSDWTVDATQAEKKTKSDNAVLTLTKQKHVLRINMPSGYGGALCVFGSSDEETPGKAVYPGTFTDIKASKYTFRRSDTPLTDESAGQATWNICQRDARDETYTITTAVDLIQYITPVKYDSALIKEMDAIVKSLDAS